MEDYPRNWASTTAKAAISMISLTSLSICRICMGFPEPQKYRPGNLTTPDFLHHFISNIAGTQIGKNNGIYFFVPQFSKGEFLFSQIRVQGVIHLHLPVYLVIPDIP